ncbi:MAG: AraC family transcriptional regulator [Cyanobacteria bacterium J06643_13]
MNDSSSSPKPKPVEPLIYFPREWEVSSQTVKIDNLVVQHNIAPPNRVPRHKTGYHRLAYELSSSTSKATFIGDEQYVGNFQKGEFCLHPKDYYASYSWETTDEIVLLALKPDFLSDIAEQSECLNPDRIELTPILKDRDPILGQIVDSFLREMNTDGLGGKLYSETLATQFAIHLLRNYSTFPLRLKQYRGGLSPSKLQTVVEYIEANLASKIGLKDLAQIAQISPSYFLRLFKQSTGITPYQYVMQRRVELGKRLLKQEKLPTVEIALMCGFANQSSFAKTFRKVVGTTPKTYQKQT